MIPAFTQSYDLLVTGGRVMDPSQDLDGPRDVAVANGRIVRIEAAGGIPRQSARRVLDATGKLVTPGLIDLHTHVAGGLRKLRDEETMVPADIGGVWAGVTTVLDAGSTGAYNVAAFINHVVDAPSTRTRVLALINVGTTGVTKAPEVRDASDIDVSASIAAMQARPDVVKGVKLRMVSPAITTLGLEVAKAAKEIAVRGGGFVLVHIGDILKQDPVAARLSPRLLTEVLDRGDVVTHSLSHQPGGLLSGGPSEPTSKRSLIPQAQEARSKGVIFDIGVGRANFSFESARRVLDTGFVPDTLSSDITMGSRLNGPTYSLTECMGKVISVGLSLQDVVRMTTLAPAKALGMADRIGSLQIGREADISVLETVEGDWVFHDITGARNRGRMAIRPVCAVRSGEVMPLDCGPRPWGWLPERA
jgi:dihydroorotase